MHLILLPLIFATIDADTFTGKVITGKVIAVKDGDSIVVLRDNEQITIRLLDIDCPELAQAFGRQAKNQTSDLCFGKSVTVKANSKDRYDRTLAHVILPGGKELNRELVKSGLAWWYRRSTWSRRCGLIRRER
jgi:endonuclease YncB( thermonuclease family)